MSCSAPEITVVLPFRDAGVFFEEALASLAAQDAPSFEVVLVDDLSVDGSADIARRFTSSDSRFRLVEPGRPGIAGALNAGLTAGRGRWAARMDADDVCTPDRLRLQLQLAESLGPRSVTGCLVECTGTAGEGWRVYESWINSLITPEGMERSIFVESPVPHPTAFFSREAILACGGYAEGDFPEDYELWLRLWSRGFVFGKVPKRLLFWRDSPSRLSRTSSRYSPKAFLRAKAPYLRMAPAFHERPAAIVWGAGTAGKNLFDAVRGHGIEVVSFVDISPGRIGGTARGRPVLPPAFLQEARRLAGGAPVLVAVRTRGGRDSAKASLEGMGLVDWEDFVVCC